MPSERRFVEPNLPYHIVQRGNYRANIFDSEEDKLFYLDNLDYYRKRHKVKLYGWCLMDNHVHLIMSPETETSFSELFRRLNVKYSIYIHKKRKLKGKLWEDRYYTSCLDEDYFLTSLKYVELNPFRAGMEKNLGEYSWTSYRERIKSSKYSILDDLPEDIQIRNWDEVILSGLKEEEKWEALKRCIAQNKPFGNEEFVKKLEQKSGLNLTTRKQGRPHK